MALLFDSNLIIYAGSPGFDRLTGMVEAGDVVASAVSYVEVLGYHRLDDATKRFFERFFASVQVFSIDAAVLERAVSLRQRQRMSLGDAIIAGTALVHGLTLATHNVKDFAWIDGLSVVDPLA